MRTPVFCMERCLMTTAAILDALHQPMTFAELRAELLGTTHNGTMSDDRKLSATLRALRKQGRVELRDEGGKMWGRKVWSKIPLAPRPDVA